MGCLVAPERDLVLLPWLWQWLPATLMIIAAAACFCAVVIRTGTGSSQPQVRVVCRLRAHAPRRRRDVRAPAACRPRPSTSCPLRPLPAAAVWLSQGASVLMQLNSPNGLMLAKQVVTRALTDALWGMEGDALCVSAFPPVCAPARMCVSRICMDAHARTWTHVGARADWRACRSLREGGR